MSTFTYRQKAPGFNNRAAGLAGVIIFHILLIYGLVSGLAQKVVQVVQQKVEVAVISEPPPPPPPPPPKVEKVVQAQPTPQPQAYVPPVVNPPPVAPTPQTAIAATTADPTPPPPVVAPPPAPVVEAPKGPVSAKANCSRLAAPQYPAKAEEDEIQGVVKVVFSIDANGKFNGIQRISYDSIPTRYQSAFKSAISSALQGYQCKQDSLMEQEFSFKLNDA